jgi:hypothetical protein
MLRTRITWVIAGALAALLILAGVDALRSPADGESAATPSTPASVDVDGTIEAKSFEGDGYSFTYPGEWTRKADDVRSAESFWTAFAPDAAAPNFAWDLSTVFSPGSDVLVLRAMPQRESEQELDPFLDVLGGGDLDRWGELVLGPTHDVTVAGLPALRAVVRLRGEDRVTLRETVIFGTAMRYFLMCRFNSAEMERGCDQVEETFEVA